MNLNPKNQGASIHSTARLAGSFLWVILFASGLWAQDKQTTLVEDTSAYVLYHPDFRFNEGIFLHFEQVKQNKPIPIERILSVANPNDFDFYEKLLEHESLAIYDEKGMKQDVPVEAIWGYSNKGILYIQHNREFNRIPVIGSICHFVSNVSYESYRNFDPYYNPYRMYDPYYTGIRTQPVVTKEMRQFLLDWQSGEIYEYNRENLQILLMQSPQLYEEYNDLSKRKQKKMLFFYLRRFNEQNPLYIPVYQ